MCSLQFTSDNINAIKSIVAWLLLISNYALLICSMVLVDLPEMLLLAIPVQISCNLLIYVIVEYIILRKQDQQPIELSNVNYSVSSCVSMYTHAITSTILIVVICVKPEYFFLALAPCGALIATIVVCGLTVALISLIYLFIEGAINTIKRAIPRNKNSSNPPPEILV